MLLTPIGPIGKPDFFRDPDFLDIAAGLPYNPAA